MTYARWCSVALLLAPLGAAAQDVPRARIKRADPGMCEVVVEVKDGPAAFVGLSVARVKYPEQAVSGKSDLTFRIAEPLRAGFPIRVEINGAPDASITVGQEKKPLTKTDCKETRTVAPDDDPALSVLGYFGTVFDNFAPDRVGNYKNATVDTRRSQEIFGLDLDYRLLGKPGRVKQLWVNAVTSHGVRTADIDCTPSDTLKRPVVCGTPTPGERSRYILANASSFEAFLSPRFEFMELQTGTDAPAKVYLHARVGLLALDSASSVFVNQQGGLGLLVNDGDYAGSYLEIGAGRNTLFSKNCCRFTLDGLLSFGLEEIPLVGKVPLLSDFRTFIEATVDNDTGGGADAIRIYLGVDLSPSKLFGK